jgi:hypothetical protein
MKLLKNTTVKTSIRTLLATILLASSGASFAEKPPAQIEVNSNAFGHQLVTTVDLGDRVISQVENTKSGEILFSNQHDKAAGIDDVASARELIELEELVKLNSELGKGQMTGSSESRSQTVTCTYTHSTTPPLTGILDVDVALSGSQTHHFSCDNGGSASVWVSGTTAYLSYTAP